MTRSSKHGCEASNYPYGKEKQPKKQKSTPVEKSTLEEKSKEQLIFMIKEQRRRIDYLHAELDFVKQQQLESSILIDDMEWLDE